MNRETVNNLSSLYSVLQLRQTHKTILATGPVSVRISQPNIATLSGNSWESYPMPSGGLRELLHRWIVEDNRLKIAETMRRIVALGGELP